MLVSSKPALALDHVAFSRSTVIISKGTLVAGRVEIYDAGRLLRSPPGQPPDDFSAKRKPLRGLFRVKLRNNQPEQISSALPRIRTSIDAVGTSHLCQEETKSATTLARGDGSFDQLRTSGCEKPGPNQKPSPLLLPVLLRLTWSSSLSANIAMDRAVTGVQM
jgi:hypothetical protein